MRDRLLTSFRLGTLPELPAHDERSGTRTSDRRLTPIGWPEAGGEPASGAFVDDDVTADARWTASSKRVEVTNPANDGIRKATAAGCKISAREAPVKTEVRPDEIKVSSVNTTTTASPTGPTSGKPGRR